MADPEDLEALRAIRRVAVQHLATDDRYDTAGEAYKFKLRVARGLTLLGSYIKELETNE